MKKLLVAAIAVLMASPAFAAIQNVKVSGDITTTFVDRSNFDLGDTLATNQNNTTDDFTGPNFQPVGLKKQNVFVTQTRLRVDADLSDNVSTTVGLINERAWNAENTSGASGAPAAFGTAAPGYANDTDVQLYLASVTMRELLYSPLTVTVGRQVFNYGNGLIMGDGGVNNLATGNLAFIAQDLTLRTAYDGVKAVLDYKPLTIDMFYFKNNQEVVTGNPNSDKTSSNVYGLNANYQLSDPMNTVVESYLFTRFNGDNNVGSALGADTTGTTDKGDTLFVPGLRASTNPIKGLNVQGEVAWQLGNHPVATGTFPTTDQETEHRDAMAAQFLASYALPVLDKYKPTVNASYTYVSGDKNGGTNYGTDHVTSAKSFTAWDPFNEIQGSGTIYNTLFPLSNLHIASVGASVNPLEDVTATATWSGLWAADSYTASNPLLLYQPDGGLTQLAPTTKAHAKGLGNEADINLTYNYTEDVTFGVSVGWYVPGSALSSVNRNTASQALADVGVKF
jgi:hypothetical protein